MTLASVPAAQALATPPSGGRPAQTPSAHVPRVPFLRRVREKGGLAVVLFALMAPTLLGILILVIYPSWNTVLYSFYDWDGSDLQKEFHGLHHYYRALWGGDPLFWQTFALVGVLLVANLFKMIPSVLTAVVLHRIKSERFQYIYRVLFVIPMIVPGLVTLLLWKSFFDPVLGILNPVLRMTGLMPVLRWLDAVLPPLAVTLRPLVAATIEPVFGNVWGLAVAGIAVISAIGGQKSVRKNVMWWMILLGISLAISGWVRGPILCAAAVVIGEVLFVQGREAGKDVTRWIGMALILLATVSVLLTRLWPVQTHAFDMGTPAWLSSTPLIIPTMIFWGFPWVGTIGVLIYLAGLQNIPGDVYEAAALDGVGSIGRFTYIELPLILTQVRINLIFMTTGTLGDFGLILLLLGPNGGPGSVGMVPGLYIYRTAFVQGNYGYACALGMVMFIITMCITILYQKYVRVEK